MTAAHQDVTYQCETPLTLPLPSKQHSRIVTMRYDYEPLPLYYASFQIDMTQGIEIMEQGRGLL